jgi:hypothetical protein
MVEPTCELIKILLNKVIVIKVIRLDNVGDNMLLEKRCKSKNWQSDISFESNYRVTPHHNHVVEMGIYVIINSIRALLIRANISFQYQFHLFRDAFKTATYIDGLIVVEVNGKIASRYEHFYGVHPPWEKFLKNCGEAGTVKTNTATTQNWLIAEYIL